MSARATAMPDDAPAPLPGVNRRGFMIGGALALTAAGAYALTPRREERRLQRHKLGELVGRSIGPWSAVNVGGVVTASEEVEDKDGYDQLLTRVYQAPGLPTVMLLIAYGSTQGGTLQLHRPETCYPGQGFGLSSFQDAAFRFPAGLDVQARRFTATRDDRVERLTYWTRIGRDFPLDTAGEYAAIMRGVLRGAVPDGILVRLSTIGVGDVVADRAIDRFAQGMIGATNALGRQVLLGAG